MGLSSGIPSKKLNRISKFHRPEILAPYLDLQIGNLFLKPSGQSHEPSIQAPPFKQSKLLCNTNIFYFGELLRILQDTISSSSSQKK